MCMDVNVEVVIDVLVTVYDKTWENHLILFLNCQLALDI